jgi:hypothetical protein
MSEQDIIKEIIFIPKDFYEKRNISIFSLLKNTGYFDLFDKINIDQILQVVIQNPECIDYWLMWSENKRVDSGWYFAKNADDHYVVDFFPPKRNSKKVYADMREACAVFIKLEIEDIRNS